MSRPPTWMADYVTGDECMFGRDSEEFEDIPASLAEVLESSEKAEWLSAMRVEFDALVRNSTWELSSLPPGKKALRGRWVFCIKRDENGHILKYKARFVAKGYGQVYGSDYCETFAPTAKLSTIRLSLALAAHLGCVVFQLDVKSAYLNARISEEVFLEQPEGFVESGSDGQPLFCRLLKSIYGLRQAGREWNRLLDSWLVCHGFVRSDSDYCLYVRSEGESRLFVVIWVDDILYFGDSSLSESFKKSFSADFSIDDKGPMLWFLGMEVLQSSDLIEVTQRSYVKEILRRFDMSDCNPVFLPAEPGTKYSKSDCPVENSPEHAEMSSFRSLYRSLLGNLQYLSAVSRPDLSFVVSNLSHFLANPGKPHWLGAKRLLRYLKGMSDFRLTFARTSSFSLSCFSDSDWGSDADDRRSVAGYCFHLGVGLVSWSSKKQQTVALSSAEAEYMGLSSASQEVIFLRSVLSDLGYLETGASMIFGDNRGSIILAENPKNHGRAKHIDIRYHFMRDLVNEGTIQLSYVPTEENVADIFTKNLPRIKFELFRQKLQRGFERGC